MSTTFVPPSPDQWQGPSAEFTPPAPSSWQGPAQLPAEPSPLEKYGSALWESLPSLSGLTDLMAGASRTPEGTARMQKAWGNVAQGIANELPGYTPASGFTPGRALSEWAQTGNALMRLDPNAALYHLFGAVPFVGEPLQQIAHLAGRGALAEALGRSTSLVGQAAAPEIAGGLVDASEAATTFAKGAVPAAAKAATQRPPILVGTAGGLIGGPKGAAIAATIAKAPSVIRAGIAGGQAALEAHAAAAAEQAATAAAARAAAREAADTALARQAQIYETGEQMTQPPARPELPPGSSYQMPEAGTYAEEQRVEALKPEVSTPAPGAGLPALTVDQLARDRFGRSFSELFSAQQAQVQQEYQGLQQPAFQGLFGQPQAAPPAPPGLTSGDLARSLYGNRPLSDVEAANVQNLYNQVGVGQPPVAPSSPRVMAPAEAAQVFPGMGLTPETPAAVAPPAAPVTPEAPAAVPAVSPVPEAPTGPAAGIKVTPEMQTGADAEAAFEAAKNRVTLEPLPEDVPPHYRDLQAREGTSNAVQAYLKDRRVAQYVLEKGITPEEFEAMPLDQQNQLIREAPTASGKGKHRPFEVRPEGPALRSRGRYADEGTQNIADTMRWMRNAAK